MRGRDGTTPNEIGRLTLNEGAYDENATVPGYSNILVLPSVVRRKLP
jgi:hypothetical protein